MVQYVPKISYRKAGLQKPKRVYALDRPAKLPRADGVVLCTSNAEAAALHHVFFNYHSAYIENCYSWKYDWQRYLKNFALFQKRLSEGSEALEEKALCFFKLVEVEQKRIMLIKLNLHANSAETDIPMLDLLCQIFQEIEPKWMFLLQTAGAARSSDHVGDVILANSAKTLFHESKRLSPLNQMHSKLSCDFSFGPLYEFSKFFLRPDISASWMADIRSHLQASGAMASRLPILPKNPHPLFFVRRKEPLLTSDTLVFPTTSGLYEEYAGIAENTALIFEAAAVNKVQVGGSFCGITMPTFDQRLLPDERAVLAGKIASYVSHAAIINASRALLKFLSNSAISL